jgi:hypothetical protein
MGARRRFTDARPTTDRLTSRSESGLPAPAPAAAAPITAIPAATATATVSAATTTAVSTTAAATESAAATAAAATATAAALACLADADGATLHVASVEGRHGCGRFGVRRHLDERKTTRPASVAIEDHSDFLDISTLCEDLAQIRFGHAIGQISDV